MLNEAKFWIENGIAVFPCWHRQKTPRVTHWQQYQTQLPTAAEVDQWFNRGLVNMAIITGWQDLVVIDFDDMDMYRMWYFWAKQTGGEPLLIAETTRRAMTNKGVHLYVTIAGEVRNRKFTGGDIRGAGGYVIAPPSIHPSGKAYRWLRPNAPILAASSLDAILPADWMPAPPPAYPLYTEHTPRDKWDAIDAPQSGALSINGVKAAVSLLSLLPEARQSSPDGRWWKAPCPFHRDLHPSFWIDTTRGLCGCHSCGMKPMDVINLYAALNGIDNRAALVELQARV